MGLNYWSDGQVWDRLRTGLCQDNDLSLEDIRESLETLVVRATMILDMNRGCFCPCNGHSDLVFFGVSYYLFLRLSRAVRAAWRVLNGPALSATYQPAASRTE